MGKSTLCRGFCGRVPLGGEHKILQKVKTDFISQNVCNRLTEAWPGYLIQRYIMSFWRKWYGMGHRDETPKRNVQRPPAYVNGVVLSNQRRQGYIGGPCNPNK